jgi:hypothetical protein
LAWRDSCELLRKASRCLVLPRDPTALTRSGTATLAQPMPTSCTCGNQRTSPTANAATRPLRRRLAGPRLAEERNRSLSRHRGSDPRPSGLQLPVQRGRCGRAKDQLLIFTRHQQRHIARVVTRAIRCLDRLTRPACEGERIIDLLTEQRLGWLCRGGLLEYPLQQPGQPASVRCARGLLPGLTRCRT